MLRKSITLLILVCACSFSEEKQDCKSYTREANKYFECYLHDRKDSCLNKAAYLIDIALSCDSLRPFNYWLKLKVLSAKNDYNSSLITIERFEKISKGPDVMFTKAEIYRKLNKLDSAKLCYQKALQRYDRLLLVDSMNTSLIIGKLQVIIYLYGKQDMLKNLEYYKEKYKSSKEFGFLEKLPLALDSIP